MALPPNKTSLPWTRWTGELIVIALGVAIGFQVDRWYEQRQDNATAQQYIERLKEDIQRDIENSSSGMASASSRMESLERIIQSVTSDDVVRGSPTGYMVDLRQSSMRYLPVPSDSTYRELVATGNMALLPIGLRIALHEYYSNIDNYSQFLGGYESTQVEARRRFAGILPPENFGSLAGIGGRGGASYSVEEALAAANKLRNNQPAVDWLFQMGELKVQEITLSSLYLEGAQNLLTIMEQQ